MRFLLGILATLMLSNGLAQELIISDDNPLLMPPVGAHQLRILSPTLLELTLVTTKKPDPATVSEWNFVGPTGESKPPNAKEFSVQVNGQGDAVNAIGFKRRVLYAPLKQRDLRIGNYLYLQLTTPVSENQSVTVLNSDKKLWSAITHFTAKADPLRWSPAIHVNEVGYLPAQSKKKLHVGYVFCSDEFLLKMNRQFLDHDFYTDIITFPLSETDQEIEAEIYISVDRVKDNAAKLKVDFSEELNRVIFHGVLHLMGYKDKSKADKETMHGKENERLRGFKRGLKGN